MTTITPPDAATASTEFLKLYQAMDAFAQDRILLLARAFTTHFPAPKRAPRLTLVHLTASTTRNQKQGRDDY
jgi:hypothetical protein